MTGLLWETSLLDPDEVCCSIATLGCFPDEFQEAHDLMTN